GITLSGSEEEGGFAFVSIRGTSPDLNNVSVNGADLASGAETRAVDLDVVPADMVKSVKVIKAVTPDMDATALGGRVEIETMTAFDRAGLFLNGTLQTRRFNEGFDYVLDDPNYRA